MTQILVIKPGTLSASDKKKLRFADVVAIEAECPDDVRLLSTEGPALGANDMLFAALSAMAHPNGTYASDVREAFPGIMLKLITGARQGGEFSE